MNFEQIRKYIYLFSIGLLIIGLPFSRAMISIGEVALLIAWIFDKNIISKLKLFINNKAALAFSSIYFLHILGMLYTSNWDYGLFDLRTKLPLLLFPMIFSSSPPFTTKELRNFLLLFSATATASISYSLFLAYTHSYNDFREAFPFVSHIRLSLEVLIAMSIMMYYGQSRYSGISKAIKIVLLIVPVYLIWTLFVLELMTGIVIFGVGVILFLVRYILENHNKRAPWIGFISGFIISIVFVLWMVNVVSDYRNAEEFNFETIDKVTSNGNAYEHIPNDYQIENGSYIGLYICRVELREAWNKRSDLDFDGEDLQHQELSMTLIRYLNSKGLRKDAQGMAQLTDEDIHNVETGIANIEFARNLSSKKRIYKIIWEYNLYANGDEAYGHSIVQRIELWRTSMSLFKKKPIFGVGTGDVKDAFQQEFVAEDSTLKDSGLRTHNQYLSIAVTLGSVGFIVFLFSLIYPATKQRVWSYAPYFYLFVIMAMSMFWEDTIESQVGVTLFAFFGSIYLFARRKL